ncbi:MAG: F0F1 ATP synthase subunit B' [Rhodospirillaceae bacterium]|nr:F0F1 ATP synthase subunit B' [Rhodospirillaceae bacterium]
MPQLEQIDTFAGQIFWLVVAFLVLFVIMWRVAVPKISDALEARQKRIDDNLERAAEIKKEAETAIEAYEKALAEARADAQGAIAEANARLVEAAAQREAELSEKLQAKVAESEANIAKAVEAAVEHLRDVAVEVAVSATERLVGEAPSESDAAAAVDGVMKAQG